MRKVMMFIDGSNLYHGMRDILGKVNIDYECFIKKLVGDRYLVRVYYYTPVINREEAEEQYHSQQRFLTYLTDINYVQAKFGKLVRQGEILVEKSIDVKLAVDMVRYAGLNYYDIAILISGDGDFVPAVEAVKEMGKQVECAFFIQETANVLKQVTDVFIELNQHFLADCIFHKEDYDYNE
ncbi:NYN domain-containing protein [bacterium]|nr:MAG: NYN domain-containing protein [bacterium]